jgi:two-component system chemotaxis response regulator CheV
MNQISAATAAELNGMELLLFYLGDKRFAIDILKVKEVIPCPSLTQVPHSHPAVSGVFQLRGAPLTVLDLQLAITQSLSAPQEGGGTVIVTEFFGDRQGFLVSRVDRIIHCRQEDFQESPPGTGDENFIEKVGRDGEELIQVLDFHQLLSSVLPASTRIEAVAC